jgi:outer membrane lipoprotein-sorting protein
LFETEGFPEIGRSLRNLALPPGAHLEVTGALSIHESIDRVLGADFFRVTWIGLFAVAFTIFILFRRVDFVVLTLVPVALAVPFLFGLMNWLSIPFTASGITLAAVILGVGIDDAAHLLTRARAGGKMDEILVEIGPVITLTTVTTMIGFGTLAGSSHPVVATMGQAICIGVLACWVFTLLVVPGAYLLVTRRGRAGATLGAAALLIGVALPVHAGGAEDQVDQTLERLSKRYKSTDTVSCRYRQSRSLKQLEGAIRVEGTILFQKPHFLKMEMRGDENVDLYCNGDTIWIVDLDLDEVETLGVDDIHTMGGRLQMIPILLFSSPEEIRSRFNVEFLEADGRRLLRLTPLLDRDFRFQLLTVELGIQDRLRGTEVLFSNGDRIETQFRDWKRLPRVSRYTFEYRHQQ